MPHPTLSLRLLSATASAVVARGPRDACEETLASPPRVSCEAAKEKTRRGGDASESAGPSARGGRPQRPSFASRAYALSSSDRQRAACAQSRRPGQRGSAGNFAERRRWRPGASLAFCASTCHVSGASSPPAACPAPGSCPASHASCASRESSSSASSKCCVSASACGADAEASSQTSSAGSYLWSFLPALWRGAGGERKCECSKGLADALLAGVLSRDSKERITIHIQKNVQAASESQSSGGAVKVRAFAQGAFTMGDIVCAETPLLVGSSRGVHAAQVFDLEAFLGSPRASLAASAKAGGALLGLGSCPPELCKPLNPSTEPGSAAAAAAGPAALSAHRPARVAEPRAAASHAPVSPFLDLVAAALLAKHAAQARRESAAQAGRAKNGAPSAGCLHAAETAVAKAGNSLLCILSHFGTSAESAPNPPPADGLHPDRKDCSGPQRELAKQLHPFLRPPFNKEVSVDELEAVISLLRLASLLLPPARSPSKDSNADQAQPCPHAPASAATTQRQAVAMHTPEAGGQEPEGSKDTASPEPVCAGFFPLLLAFAEEPTCRPNVLLSFTERQAEAHARSGTPRFPSLAYLVLSPTDPASSSCCHGAAAAPAEAAGAPRQLPVRVSQITSLESLYAPTFMREAGRRRRNLGVSSIKPCACERCTSLPEACRSFNCQLCHLARTEASSQKSDLASLNLAMPPIVCPTGPSKSRSLADTPMRCLRCGQEPSAETKQGYEAAEKGLFMALMTAAHVPSDKRRLLPPTALDALADAAVGSNAESRALIADTHFLRIRQFTQSLFQLAQERSQNRETPSAGSANAALPVRPEKPELLRRRCDAVIEATRAVVGPHPDEARFLEHLALATREEVDFQRAYSRRQDFCAGSTGEHLLLPPYAIWKSRLLSQTPLPSDTTHGKGGM
ncbi:hypothetical protein BESB_005280 [Besnoitia besnoiti]|uniref:Uncharacterized protein n=1 Tax=Besnoitia besnoiti TaxID=94643 RepID=A0A2A9MPZ1_BESBE|nr:hypothetical protein BESB_005280 [Besnoitia besnoiti]PFH38187.1 hypothetical protein BESB_005280 [Besnoitia besnoiti]